MRRAVVFVALVLAAVALAMAVARAGAAFTAQQLADLSFHQHPGASLPLDATLIDEDGRHVRLGDLFSGKPVILVLDYLHCKTLCGFVLGNLARAAARVRRDAGADFSVVALSIDPRETPADARAARAQYRLQGHDTDGRGWHFLTGSADEVRRVAAAVGFPYRYDEDADQFAHPAGFVVAAPNGTIARYVLGIDYAPLDLRLAVAEAGRGTISSPVNDLLLLCYCYDPQTGRYGPAIGNALRIAGGLTVLGIMAMVGRLMRMRRG
jgi:protein SCO1